MGEGWGGGGGQYVQGWAGVRPIPHMQGALTPGINYICIPPDTYPMESYSFTTMGINISCI